VLCPPFADIAEVAAKILSAPAPHANKTYKIGAPSDTFANLAKYYTEAVGKPVTYTPVSATAPSCCP